MTITRTLQNAAGGTPDSVNITPFDQTWRWVESGQTMKSLGPKVQAQFSEYRAAGDDPEYPLVRRAEVYPIILYHPAAPKTTRMNGKELCFQLYTTQVVEDSVSGERQHIPVRTTISVAHGGGVVLNEDDILQFLLSHVGQLWSSVSTGVPNGAVMDKVALFATDF